MLIIDMILLKIYFIIKFVYIKYSGIVIYMYILFLNLNYKYIGCVIVCLIIYIINLFSCYFFNFF